MAKNSGKRTEIEYRRRLIASLYHEGIREQSALAEALEDRYKVNVNRSTVSRDLKFLREQWKQEARQDFEDARANALAEIEYLKAVNYEAWRRSLEKRTIESGKTVQTGDDPNKPDRTEASIREEQMLGDPRFLAGVQWCIDRRIKLLGFDAPQKIEHGGGVIFTIDDLSQAHQDLTQWQNDRSSDPD